jgi:hypothetical protein
VTRLRPRAESPRRNANKLVEITDPLNATAPASSESFRTVRAAGFGEVLRGVSFTPGTRGR